MDIPPVRLYQHAPLDRSDSIRLLELLPDDFGQPLKCLIHPQPHDHRVPYEALSYTWDEPVFPERILAGVDLSSPCIPITQNLYNALQHLRFQRTSRMLWIDAICINQSDSEEKGHQVSHMGKLYSGAASVTVWLGLTPSKNILNLLEKVCACYHAIATPRDDGSQPVTKVIRLLARLRVGKLFESAWFSRVWTVQEFVLGRHVWFQIGLDRFEEETMGSALKTILLALDIYSTPKYVSQDFARVAFVNDLFLVREQYRSSGLSVMRPISPPISLSRCISSLARHRSCSDKRDRIYGMLAITNDLSIEPDYAIPVQDLFLDFARKSLQQGDYTLLHEHNMDDYGGDALFPLSALEPSSAKHYPVWRSSYSTQHRSGFELPALILVGTEGRVEIKGVLLDLISKHVVLRESRSNSEGATADQLIPAMGRNKELFYQDVLLHLYQEIGNRDSLHSEVPLNAPNFSWPPYTNEPLIDVVYRVLATNPVTSESLSKMFSSYSSWRFVQEEELLHRSLFRTQAGYCGVGSHHLLPGDKVVLFNGAATPFILREETNADDQWTGRYKLVSDCYLHGWMDGGYFGHTVVDDDGKVVYSPPSASLGETDGSKYRVLKEEQFVIC